MLKYWNYQTGGLLLAAATLLVGSSSFGKDLEPEDLYAQLLPSVVTLKVRNGQGEHFTGAGFLALAQDTAVTAWHVVSDAVCVTAQFANGDEREVLGVVDKSTLHDLALLKLSSRDHPLTRLAQTAPRIGARVYVIGAPKGFSFSIADGLVSQIQTVDGFPQYQVSCPFSTGNSGGPLVNEQGEVIGVASWSKLGAQNLNFAVPVELIAKLNPLHEVVPWAQVTLRESPPNEPQLPPALDGLAITSAADNLAAQPELKALQKVLKAAGGKPITLVVRQDQMEQTFHFIMPR